MKDVVVHLKTFVLSPGEDNENTLEFHVRDDFLLMDSLVFAAKKRFKPNRPLKVLHKFDDYPNASYGLLGNICWRRGDRLWRLRA